MQFAKIGFARFTGTAPVVVVNSDWDILDLFVDNVLSTGLQLPKITRAGQRVRVNSTSSAGLTLTATGGDSLPASLGLVVGGQEVLLISTTTAAWGLSSGQSLIGSNIQIGGTGGSIGFYGATPIAIQALVPLTDNSGGVSGGNTIAVIGGAVDPTAALKADTANAIATVAAKLNALIADLGDTTGVGLLNTP